MTAWGGTHVIGCKGLRHMIGCRRWPCRKNVFVNHVSHARWVSKICTQMHWALRQMHVWQFIYQWKLQITDDLFICEFLLHIFKTRNICVHIKNMFTNLIFICDFFFYLYMDWSIFVCALKMHLCIESYIYTTPQIRLWGLFCAFIPLCVHLSIMRLLWLHKPSTGGQK